MRKVFISVITVSLLLSSCETYTGSGAYSGSTLGAILGSAIGGIADGPRGSDIGTIVGMAGGAIIGGAIGNAQDRKRESDLEQYQRDKAGRAAARAARKQAQQYDDQSYNNGYQSYDDQKQDGVYQGSGFDSSNSGDDRIYDFTSKDYTGDYSAQEPNVNLPLQSGLEDLAKGLKYMPTIEVRNARFVDSNQDGQIERNELSKIIFEVINTGTQPLYDVQPTVTEATNNKHIFISPNMHVEKIMPGKGIRYTAIVKADNRLKPGNARFCVSVIQGTTAISKVSEFNIPTKK
ncbi:MAG: hypothetical protein PHC48_07600 [Prevotella sp.]|nr:hypothetical protein [Prevotella sp.]